MSIHVSSLAVLAVLSPLLSAQGVPPIGPDPCLPYVPENTIVWDTPPSFGRIVVAELDGDQAPEGVVIESGHVFVLWKLAVYEAVQEIQFPVQANPTAVRDVAVLPGRGTQPGTDALVMTDNRGLYIVQHDGDGYFPDPVVIQSTPPSTLWRNAAPIHVDDVNGDSYLDVIGVAADQRAILLVRGAATGFESTFTSVAQPNTTRDVVAVDRFPLLPGSELVALTTRGLRTHNSAGTFLSANIYLSSTGCLTRFSTGGWEQLAWTRATASGSELVIVGEGAPGPGLPMTFNDCMLGAIQPTALVAGDYNNDENEDLVLVHGGSETGIVLVNDGGQFSNGSAWFDSVVLSDDPGAPVSVGIPAFTEVDGDGVDDLVFPVSSSQRIEVFLSLPYIRDWIQGQPITSADIFLPNTEFGPELLLGAPGRLRLAFTVPPVYESYNTVTIILWHQSDREDVGMPMPPVDLQAVCNRSHGLLSEFEPNQWVRIDNEFQDGTCWADADVDGDDYPIFYVEFRFVRTSTNTKSKIFTAGFRVRHCPPAGGSDTYTDYDYLIGMGIANRFMFQVNGLTGLPQGSGSQEIVGIFVPMSSQPPFAPGTRIPGDQATGDEAKSFWH